MVDEECLLTDRFGTVNGIFDGHVIDVENPGDKEEEAGKVIGPKIFVNVLVKEAHNARDKERWNHIQVGCDPESI